MIGSDIMSSAIFSTSAKLSNLPINIIARATGDPRDRRLAHYSDILFQYYWNQISTQAALDWQAQDNGFFVEIMGGGNPGGRIEPTKIPGTKDYVYATGLRVLDSQWATRTGDPEYPVRYIHIDSKGSRKEYKFHHSRILFDAQMKSSRQRMYEIGLCGLSRVVRTVLRQDDISLVEDEMLGSRPVSQIIFSKVLTAEQMEDAFVAAEDKMYLDRHEQRRSSRAVFLSVKGAPETVKVADITSIPLRKFPEGYDYQVYVDTAMSIIAMGLGFDKREFWPGTERGATRGDAEVQHMKTKAKTPGLWEGTWTHQLQQKWVPPGAIASAYVQDADQDEQEAKIRLARSQAYRQYLQQGDMMDHQALWELMLEDGLLSEAQFDRLMSKQAKFDAMMEARNNVVNGNGNSSDGSSNGDNSGGSGGTSANGKDRQGESPIR